MTYTIRTAVAEDMLKLRPMHAKSWIATYPSEENGVSYAWVKNRTDNWQKPDKMAESIEILRTILSDDKQFYRLAEDEHGAVSGFVHVRAKEDGTNELEAIYTLPEAFGTGLGPRLMDEAIAWIGDTTTTLKVISYNDRAINFYTKYGFVKVEGSEGLFAEVMPVEDMIREVKKA